MAGANPPGCNRGSARAPKRAGTVGTAHARGRADAACSDGAEDGVHGLGQGRERLGGSPRAVGRTAGPQAAGGKPH